MQQSDSSVTDYAPLPRNELDNVSDIKTNARPLGCCVVARRVSAGLSLTFVAAAALLLLDSRASRNRRAGQQEGVDGTSFAEALLLGAPQHPLSLIFLALFLAICVVLYQHGPKILGVCIKAFLEKVDRFFLGTDVHIGELELSVCHGELRFKRAVVDNPPKFPVGPCIEVERSVWNFDLGTYIGSGGRYSRLPSVRVDGVQIYLHKRAVDEGTLAYNIEVIIDNLDHAVDLHAILEHGPEKVFIHRLEIRNVTVPSHKTDERSCFTWPTLVVPDIVFDDFDKETGIHLTSEVLKFLWKLILESAWHSAQHALKMQGMQEVASVGQSARDRAREMTVKTKEKFKEEQHAAREKIDRLVHKFNPMTARDL